MSAHAPVVVVDRGEAGVECFTHVLGETHRMDILDARDGAVDAEWLLYVCLAPGRPLRLHLYFGDVPRLLRRALRRPPSGDSDSRAVQADAVDRFAGRDPEDYDSTDVISGPP